MTDRAEVAVPLSVVGPGQALLAEMDFLTGVPLAYTRGFTRKWPP